MRTMTTQLLVMLSLTAALGCARGIQFGPVDNSFIENTGSAGSDSGALSFCGNVRTVHGAGARLPVRIINERGEVVATVETDEEGNFSVTVNMADVTTTLYVQAHTGDGVQVSIVDGGALTVIASSSPSSPSSPALEIGVAGTPSACGRSDVVVDPEANRNALRTCLDLACPDLWGEDPTARRVRETASGCEDPSEAQIDCLFAALLDDGSYRTYCGRGERHEACEAYEGALRTCPEDCPSSADYFGDCTPNLLGTWYSAQSFLGAAYLVTATFEEGGSGELAYDSEDGREAFDMTWSQDESGLLGLLSEEYCGKVPPTLFYVTFEGCDCFKAELAADDTCGLWRSPARFCTTPAPPESVCYNGVDDDEDGLSDCEDPDCLGMACDQEVCGLCQYSLGGNLEGQGGGFSLGREGGYYDGYFGVACVAQEPCDGGGPAEICDDEIDNDGDDFVDCDDSDCAQDPACPSCPDEAVFYKNCGDDIDNDCDGLTDCEDDACLGGFDCVCVDPAECGNWGYGENGACGPDCYCEGFIAHEGNCGDSEDDDGDGAADCDDPDGDCFCAPECGGPCEVLIIATPEDCNDGYDTDLDGIYDCCDSDCSSVPACGGLTETEICTNGTEDDGDAAVDCADTDCGNDASCNASNDCCSTSEGPGCTDLGIRDCVCAYDPYCCATAWDVTCVSEVDSQGCGSCGN